MGYHAITKISPIHQPKEKKVTYSNIFGRWICEIAQSNPHVTAITPAMKEGSDLVAFATQYPNRFFDVAIAEQHALTLAAGMACQKIKPVVAIYSTFLQRAYDQLIHDISIQDLDLLLAIDRAGLVGEDGATHSGVLDISMLRGLPKAVIMTPSSAQELRNMLYTGFLYKGLAAVRYPRGSAIAHVEGEMDPLEIGRSLQIRKGEKVALLNFGPLLKTAQAVADSQNYSLVDMRFVKPLDGKMVEKLANNHQLLVTLEDHSIIGGAGSEVSEHLHHIKSNTPLLTLGIPDKWIGHATREEQLAECGLDQAGIAQAIEEALTR